MKVTGEFSLAWLSKQKRSKKHLYERVDSILLDILAKLGDIDRSIQKLTQEMQRSDTSKSDSARRVEQWLSETKTK